jgi:hypothetical protein
MELTTTFREVRNNGNQPEQQEQSDQKATGRR